MLTWTFFIAQSPEKKAKGRGMASLQTSGDDLN